MNDFFLSENDVSNEKKPLDKIGSERHEDFIKKVSVSLFPLKRSHAITARTPLAREKNHIVQQKMCLLMRRRWVPLFSKIFIVIPKLS